MSFSEDIITENVAPNYVILEKCENFVKVACETGYYSNNNSIIKTVIFSRDLKIKVQICQKDVNLHFNNINDSFVPDKEGIQNVCKQVDCLQLCQGILLNNRDFKRQNHIIEELLNCCGKDISHARILRSAKCQMVSRFDSRERQNCVKCQRIVVHYTEKKDGDEKEKQTTEDIIKSLMPSASENLITFVLSKVNNVSLNANTNGIGRSYQNV